MSNSLIQKDFFKLNSIGRVIVQVFVLKKNQMFNWQKIKLFFMIPKCEKNVILGIKLDMSMRIAYLVNSKLKKKQ